MYYVFGNLSLQACHQHYEVSVTFIMYSVLNAEKKINSVELN